MTTSADVRARLIYALRDDLIGPDPDDARDAAHTTETLSSAPSHWYLAGFLAPSGQPAEEKEDETAQETLDSALDNPDDGEPEPQVARRPVFPSSMGLSVLVEPGTQALKVRVTYGTYSPGQNIPSAPTELDRKRPSSRPPPGDEQERDPVPRLHWVRQPHEHLETERRKTDDRYASLAQLVWSGPSEGEQSIRDTRVVLDGLFHRADQYVLISTYVIHNGRAVFSSLAQRIRERPAMTVEIYANLPSKTGLDEDERAEAAEYLDVFAREHWPPDLPLPALYYDPDARTLGSKRATLHAKCVVVDDRWAFITSANFTEAAQERNIEAGVLLDHPNLAAALATRFRALRESGRLRRMGAG